MALSSLTACVIGCSDESPVPDEDFDLPDTVTWHEHIHPLVQAKCVGCHQEGAIAPMALDTYDLARMWSRQSAAAIEANVMPPWGARNTDECTLPGEFKDDVSLSDEEKALYARWLEQGTPEGDPSKAAALPEPIDTRLLDPALSLAIPSPVTVDGNRDGFVCFRIDPGFTEDTWVSAAQVVPGNPLIVHHALVFVDTEDESADLIDEDGRYDCFGGPNISNPSLLLAWAPGAPPVRPPETSAMLLPAGAKLVVQVHYHPTGAGPEVDEDTRIDLALSNESPTYTAALFLIGNFDQENESIAGGEGFGLTTGPDFMIPAGATDHVEINRFKVPPFGAPIGLPLWVVGTHMHYVGTDMLITLERGGTSSCLVQTPEWDFNWQRGYFFDGPIGGFPKIYEDDELTMRCTYDNSLDNPHVRDALASQDLDAPVDVLLGEETLDEMCLGIFGILIPNL